MVVARIRVIGVASAVALIGALGTAAGQGAAAGQSPGAGVTFTSQPTTVQLVTHYVIAPTQGGSSSAGPTAGTARDTSAAPLAHARASARATAQKTPNGVTSDNTVFGASKGTPAPTASFIGQQASNITCTYFAHGCNPPDMAIAASPRFVLQGVNTSWEVLDTAGNVQPGWPVDAQKFFGVANDTLADGTTPCDVAHGSRPFLSDPRALYDAADGHFWAAELQIAGVPGLQIASDCPLLSVMWVAVSQTSDPNGAWNVYKFNTSLDGVFINDYTQIGIDSQAIYVSANMFNIDAGGNVLGFYAELFEANKLQMENGKARFTPDAFFNLQATGPGATPQNPFLADTVQPAMNLDSSAGSAENFVGTLDGPDPVSGHLCSSFRDSCSGLALWTMTNPVAHDSKHGGPAPTLTAQYIATKPFVFPNAADQPSCSNCIDGNDLRTPGTPVVRNGILYTAWGTAANNGKQSVPVVEWAEISLDGGGATSDYYGFPGDGAATYPALMPDAQGNVLMVFEHMSDTVFPEARYIVKAAGDTNFHGTGLLLKAGEDNYRPQLCGVGGAVCRWGDYEAATFDGAGNIWFAGQYANTLNLGAPQFGRNWGTWIGAISAS